MTTKTSFEILPLDGGYSFGALVVNLDRDSLQDAAVRQALVDLWIEKGVLIFRDVTDSAFQIELSKVFGELELHAVSEVRGKEYPELAAAHYVPNNDGMLYEVDGEERGGWLPWHTDTIYDDKLHRGTTLRAVVIPSRLGQTGFIDKLDAYEVLPEDMKKRLEGLDVIYKRDFNLDQQPFVPEDVRIVRYAKTFKTVNSVSVPRSLHPAVYLYKDLNRMAFNVSPHPAFGISGMENEEGDALLREAIKCGIGGATPYFHEWRVNDMVVWDNWRMMHYAVGGPPDEERWMERAQIAGDYGLGRWEDAA